jgi:DNA helicase-2/ATP-dependent DNA helicase PcrA
VAAYSALANGGVKNEKTFILKIEDKTAKPQTRNELMGKTKNASGNYFRQLVFYKLLLDSEESKKYQMKAGLIDFVEPDDRGNYRKELFEITEADCADLKKTIETVSQEIYSGAFWTKECDDEACQFCQLRRMLEVHFKTESK